MSIPSGSNFQHFTLTDCSSNHTQTDQNQTANTNTFTIAEQEGLSPDLSTDLRAESRIEQLLQKIGKEGSFPSKTGLSLDDAMKIDYCVNQKLIDIKSRISEPNIEEIIWKVKRGENDSPCPILFFIKSDQNNDPIKEPDGSLRIMATVLLKGKVTASEFNEQTMHALDPDELKNTINQDPNRRIKIRPLSENSKRIYKAAFDWITGESLVEVCLKPVIDQEINKPPSERRYLPTYTLNRDLFFMDKLRRKPGITEAYFKSYVKKRDGLKCYRYMMPIHPSTLLAVEQIESGKRRRYTNQELFSCFEGLVNGLVSLHNAKVIHQNIQLSNTLLTKSGTHCFSNFNFANTYKEHLDNFKLQKPIISTTPSYLAPELIIQRKLAGGVFQDACDYPYAKDLWATGIVIATIMTTDQDFRPMRKFTDQMQSFINEDTTMPDFYERVDSEVKNMIQNAREKFIPSNQNENLLLRNIFFGLIKQMLVADPKNRIDPHTLQRLVALMKKDFF